MYSAKSSFPTPVSPISRTDESDAEIVSMREMMDRIDSLCVTIAIDCIEVIVRGIGMSVPDDKEITVPSQLGPSVPDFRLIILPSLCIFIA